MLFPTKKDLENLEQIQHIERKTKELFKIIHQLIELKHKLRGYVDSFDIAQEVLRKRKEKRTKRYWEVRGMSREDGILWMKKNNVGMYAKRKKLPREPKSKAEKSPTELVGEYSATVY